MSLKALEYQQNIYLANMSATTTNMHRRIFSLFIDCVWDYFNSTQLTPYAQGFKPSMIKD